jgi:hypothetical protein
MVCLHGETLLVVILWLLHV